MFLFSPVIEYFLPSFIFNGHFLNGYYDIMIGVATIDFDINSASYDTTNNYGWYYNCYKASLYSVPPHNYQGKGTNLKYKNNEIKIIMNMKNRTLKFIIDNKNKGKS